MINLDGVRDRWVSASLYPLEIAAHQVVALRQINHVMSRLEFAGRGDVQLIFAGTEIRDLIVALVVRGVVPFSPATVLHR